MEPMIDLIIGAGFIITALQLNALHRRVHALEETERRRKGLAIQAQAEYEHYFPFNNEQD